MQQTLSIILIELLLVLLIALIVMVFMNWRTRNRQQAALEKLIDEINEGQKLRRNKILAFLIKQYKLDENTANDLSSALFGAEKIFFVQFVEQQMQGSVAAFCENLSELLDSYLTAISEISINDSRLAKASVLPKTNELSDVANVEETQIGVENEPPPDWGDVFE